MDELVNLVVEKTGIPKDKATLAVQTVLDFIKQRLPPPIAAQVDGIVAGGKVDDVLRGLSGLLGQK